ncbi:hypothetical protein [Granulicella sibirica]|uniref:Uncharacterized protein n=1 Tax=Granulicella sibirica TaxID=2479048 RepID=A0A4V1L578_9BACT|nr:hypothetical protein [Granulicella sibirica]RXH54814.1 hypothetical protein GRAN_3918 [Granulicella sibirica]
MSMVRVVAAALAVWRLTHLIHSEDGPFRILKRMREALRRLSMSGAVDCFLCLSIWVAVPFGCVLGSSFAEVVILILAFSAVTILIDRSAGLSEQGALFLEEPYKEEVEAWPVDADSTEFDRRIGRNGRWRRSA